MVIKGQLVTFTLNGVQFGINLMQVDIIERPTKIYPVPLAPSYIEGLVDLRNRIYTVYNGRKLFGFETVADPKDSRILMATVNGESIGIIADSVHSLVNVEGTDIQNIPDDIPDTWKPYLDGTVKHDGKTVLMLNLEKLISLPPSHANNV